MSTRINAASVLESIEKGADTGSTVADNFNQLIAFTNTAGSAAVLTTVPGAGHLLAAAAVSAQAAGQVIKIVSGWRSRRHPVPPYEQFRILFYTTCHRAYLEALDSELSKLAKARQGDVDRPQPDYGDIARRAREVTQAEVTYLLSVDPLQTELPLFDAYDRWLRAVLPSYGLSGDFYGPVSQVSKAARDRLRVLLAQSTPDAAWMREYLTLSQQEKTTEVLTSLAAVTTSLNEWTERNSGSVKRRYQDAWDDYREILKRLPDLNDTMFAETFGVRQVFVAPEAIYQVIGVSRKSYPVRDVPSLLGALLSERIPPGELRILCGGPGSGKSTVCRMLASELAMDPAMHPVFLRLRHMKEGADLVPFVAEHLRNEGLIDRISDLRDVPNLVLILDGFDELVLASRARLRNFFNVLREELATGPLRFARAIVSGRDTLFPNGDGLPIGAHVLTIAPFDAPRVTEWGRKWRALHEGGAAAGFHPDFHPENLLPDATKGDRVTPLQHLACWPLTLHLLARLHTSGSLNLGRAKEADIEKAFLYRGIMADAARRQTEQASGRGRFDRGEMQRFLRRLAWEMYSRGTDSLDFHEVMPLVRKLYPDATEADVAEITDVAIVNAPELTKGEETGCEFVHKSFSEYLAAEHIAETVERTAFKVAEFGVTEPTWRMSTGDATAALASVLASRLVTAEVQEMLEPMLGCVQGFFGTGSVEEVRASLAHGDSLARIIERLEMMLTLLVQGKHLDLIARLGSEEGLAETAFEAFANYCAGIMIVGTATARRASASARQVYFNGEPAPGTFWRCIGLLEAGGFTIDERIGWRLFRQMTLASREAPAGAGKLQPPFPGSSFPVRLSEFTQIHHYNNNITSFIEHVIDDLVDATATLVISEMSRMASMSTDEDTAIVVASRLEEGIYRFLYHDPIDLMVQLRSVGLVSEEFSTNRHLLLGRLRVAAPSSLGGLTGSQVDIRRFMTELEEFVEDRALRRYDDHHRSSPGIYEFFGNGSPQFRREASLRPPRYLDPPDA